MFNISIIQAIIKILSGESSYSTIPLYLQKGDSCTVASLISAILIWNIDQKDAQINDDPIIVYAFNLILIHLEEKKTTNESDEIIYDILKIYRNSFQKGNQCTQEEYQNISFSLWYYLSELDIENKNTALITAAQTMLSLQPDSVQSETHCATFNDIFSNNIISSLENGNISQVCWANKAGPHAFLIGRLQNGEWFWYDQAGIVPDHAFMIKASSLNELKSKIELPDIKSNYSYRSPQYTGVKPLAPIINMINAMKNIVPDESFLAEIDNGPLCIGEKLYAKGFVSRHYAPFVSSVYTLDDLRYHALEEAKRSADNLEVWGALIVEKPVSVFTLYKTNRVIHDCNMEIDKIDSGDSGGGLLLDETKFRSAWLRVCSTSDIKSDWIEVY